MTGGRAALLAALVAAQLAGTACDTPPLVPEQPRPFVYLVLNQTVRSEVEPAQRALLLTMVRADSVVYRGAERFEMRRLSDGALFAWRSARTPGPVNFGRSGAELWRANWHLADSATSEGLGRADLEPGATYELVVETEGEVIRGRATIPDTFSVSVLQQGGERVAVWPSVDGAAGYSVDALGDSIRGYRFQPDTTWILTASDTAVTVQAVGPNVARYRADDDARRSGIEGGLGVFGALQKARWEP